MNNYRNNRKNRFKSNGDRNFRKRNGNGHKINGDFNNASDFKRRHPGKNNQNAAKLVEKYNDLAREALSNGDKIKKSKVYRKRARKGGRWCSKAASRNDRKARRDAAYFGKHVKKAKFGCLAVVESHIEDISLATAGQGFPLRSLEGCDTGINWQL